MNANRIKSHGLKDGALFEEKGFGRLFSKFLAVAIPAVLVAATLPAPAFADAMKKHGDDATVIVMPFGGATLPTLR